MNKLHWSKVKFNVYKGLTTDTIWYHSPENGDIFVEDAEHRHGFSGQEIVLELVDGNRVTLYGPWMSNPKAFEQNTGVTL